VYNFGYKQIGDFSLENLCFNEGQWYSSLVSQLVKEFLSLKTIITYLLAYLLKIALWFRYRIKVKGLENLNSQTLQRPGGVLFLPNHPASFTDPVAISLSLFHQYPIRPMIIEYMYNLPLVNSLMRFVGALPVPNFTTSSNSIKKKKIEAVTTSIIQGLKDKENFLIYPAGRLKDTSLEVIGGASSVHAIIQESPEANIVLVRIKGLWGSSFSRAFLGITPPLFPTMWEGVKHVFKNLIFFTPRRKVIIEFVPAPADFPRNGTRLEMNKYLEDWYNLPDGLTVQKGELPGDSLMLVSQSMWGEDYPAMRKEATNEHQDINLQKIPQETQDKVLKKLSELTEMTQDKIKPDMQISADLGLDSLDAAELGAFLHDEFDVANVSATQLTSVGHLMAVASSQVICEAETQDEDVNLSKWNKLASMGNVDIPQGKTIPEVFLNICDKASQNPACADGVSGVLTYQELKMRVLLLADYITKLPGDYIGILLPSSVGAAILILATELAGKTPLMINWTVGSNHLESVVKLSNVEVVLTSWAFLDRLDNVNFDPIESKLIMLEDVRKKLGIVAKAKAYYQSKFSAKSLVKKFKCSSEKPAVLLFTSGTESMPKGVPLSHDNILSNLRAGIKTVDLSAKDVLYGILPPFHAFGFTISTMLGLLSGIRVAFSPDPTDGKKLVNGAEKWGITVLGGAPTFIKGMLSSAKKGQLEKLRLIVTGAEKAPPELFEMMNNIDKSVVLLEGYGITECAPILTMNRSGKKPHGVGEAVDGVELLIVHPETNEVMPQGKEGHILARGANIFSGYLNTEAATPFITVNSKTWYKTGDLGFLNENNCLTISGRLKRFIKVGAEMVSLGAIEDTLLKIALAKKWEVDNNGPILAISAKEQPGEKPKIFLFSRFDVSAEEVNKLLKESGFSNIVKISSVTKLAEIPLMGSGKVNYRKLDELSVKGVLK
jgi:long-chain-fatty-acid--[acyl-carrier-protein] ligase